MDRILMRPLYQPQHINMHWELILAISLLRLINLRLASIVLTTLGGINALGHREKQRLTRCDVRFFGNEHLRPSIH